MFIYFNLTDVCTSQEEHIEIPTENDNNNLNVIRTLVNSCLRNKLTKEQCFDIISDVLINDINNK